MEARERKLRDLRRKFNVSEERAAALVDAGLDTVPKVYQASAEVFEHLGTTKPTLRKALAEG